MQHCSCHLLDVWAPEWATFWPRNIVCIVTDVCFFVHLGDKLQVLGCISASFVRSTMNKTLITSMHQMHLFTNESEAIWGSVTVTIAWVKVVSKLWQSSWQGVTRASRVTRDKPLSCYFRIRSCPRHQKLFLAIWMHTICFCSETIQHHEILFLYQSQRDNSVWCSLISSSCNYFKFFWFFSKITITYAASFVFYFV